MVGNLGGYTPSNSGRVASIVKAVVANPSRLGEAKADPMQRVHQMTASGNLEEPSIAF
jgi:hypothetical protein